MTASANNEQIRVKSTNPPHSMHSTPHHTDRHTKQSDKGREREKPQSFCLRAHSGKCPSIYLSARPHIATITNHLPSFRHPFLCRHHHIDKIQKIGMAQNRVIREDRERNLCHHSDTAHILGPESSASLHQLYSLELTVQTPSSPQRLNVITITTTETKYR